MGTLLNAVDWRMTAAAKKADQDGRLAALPSALFLSSASKPDDPIRLTEKEAIELDREYLSASAREITKNIEKKKEGWTASRVLEAYIRSAVRAHQATNCLASRRGPFVQLNAYLALNRPRSCSRRRWSAPARSTKSLPGRARSKDPCMASPSVSRTRSTSKARTAPSASPSTPACEWSNTIRSRWARRRRANHPVTSNAEVVQILVEAGAIPFTKTNVPQTCADSRSGFMSALLNPHPYFRMLAFECANPLFGPTTNPYSPAFTCGGSSGGEAALIGSDGSPLGIGSDIGGSLRIPAHYSGCYGLKPVCVAGPVLMPVC